MFSRFAKVGVLAALILLATAAAAEAFGQRQGAQRCPTPVYYDCCCPYPSGHCHVYRVSEPVVDVNGPFPTLLRGATVGQGVIVQFDVPAGAPPFPTDLFQVIQSGPGQMQYVGWNKRVVTPGLPGSPTRYSVFLCPLKPGECRVEVGLAYSNNTMKSVPYKFDIR